MKKVLRVFPKCWHLYAYIRNAPETIGPQRKHKLFVCFMYFTTVICALYMVLNIISHQPVFKSIEEYTSQKFRFEFPSIILCPEKSNVYQYSFFQEPHRISQLGLSIDAVNILAKASKEGKLEATETANLLAPYSKHLKYLNKMSPKQIWQTIIHWMYYEPELYYDKGGGIGGIGNGGYRENVEIECYYQRKGNSEKYYRCAYIDGIWLTDNSYCLIWEYTGRSFLLKDKVINLRVFLRFKEHQTYRVWIGNLLTNQIKFDTLAKKPRRYYTTVYKIYRKTEVACQPLIDQFCNTSGSRNVEMLDDYWAFLTVQSEYAEGDLFFQLDLSPSWFTMKRVSRFSKWKIAEIAGNAFGVWTGICMLAFANITIALIKKWLEVTDLAVLLVQAATISALVAVCVYLQLGNIEYLKGNRYVNQLNVAVGQGAPFPDFHLCPRQLATFNETEVKKHKISLPLLQYITVTAILESAANKAAPWEKPYFLYEKETPAEVGYHWSFMKFPLQFISEELYEQHMTNVEKEYEQLANKLGVDPSEPSWNVMTRLLLDPCKAIKYCYINGQVEMSCCVYFRFAAMQFSHNFHACWLFDNSRMRLKQRQPGKYYGFRIVLDLDEMAHAMPHLWLDDFLLDYAKSCTRLYNCSTEYPLSWNPYSAFILRMNEATTEDLFLDLKGRPGYAMNKGEVAEVRLQSTKQSRLRDKIDNQCQNHKRIVKMESYIKQEIVRKQCGCYVCHDPPIYHTQTGPCCTPKEVGRCITKREMHISKCYRKGDDYKRYKGVSTYQLEYAGNLPTEAPINFMVEFDTTCDIKYKFRNTKFDIVFRKSYKNESELTKPACTAFKTVTRVTRTKNEVEQEKGFFVYNLYYPLAQYLEFAERDLLNFYESLGLFCGTLGLLFGLTYMALLELLVTFSKKTYNTLANITSHAEFFSLLANYGLLKFRRRFRYLMTGANTAEHPGLQCRQAVQAPAAQVIKVEPTEENYELASIDDESTDKYELPQSSKRCKNSAAKHVAIAGDVPEDKLVKTSLGTAKAHDDKIADPAGEVTDAVSTPNNIKRTDTDSPSSEILLDAFYCIVLVSAVCFAIIFCIRLQRSMAVDRVAVQFDLKQTGIYPPTLGICMNRRESTKSMKLFEKQILAWLLKCQLEGITVDCKKLFSVFARVHAYDCAFSIYDGFETKTNKSSNDLEIEFVDGHGTLNIWAGDLKTINDGVIAAEHLLHENKHLVIAYQQWEVKESSNCGHELRVDCLTCDLFLKHDIVGQCCAWNQSVGYNISAARKTHCVSSFYELEASEKDSFTVHNTTTRLSLFSEVNLKRVVSREQRRTLSEKAVLYAGYVDLFIGINMDNVISVMATLVISLFV